MYAQVIQGGSKPDARDQMSRAVIEAMIPALQEQPGFCGTLNLEDPVTGHGMMINLWETEDQARRPPSGEAVNEALTRILSLSTGEREPIRVWHVNTLTVERPAGLQDAD